MFDKELYIRNSLNIFFPRQPKIRREANEIEDILTPNYHQPQVVSVPDEMDPQIPRLIFGSNHGYSQIVISQINATLNVNYSPDWQENIDLGKEYLEERVSDLIRITEKYERAYSGLTTVVRLLSNESDEAILELLNAQYGGFDSVSELYDIDLKFVKVVDEKYYNNMRIRNFRQWKEDSNTIRRLSKDAMLSRGIEIICDFNNRYIFNESRELILDSAELQSIIYGGIEDTKKEVLKIRGMA